MNSNQYESFPHEKYHRKYDFLIKECVSDPPPVLSYIKSTNIFSSIPLHILQNYSIRPMKQELYPKQEGQSDRNRIRAHGAGFRYPDLHAFNAFATKPDFSLSSSINIHEIRFQIQRHITFDRNKNFESVICILQNHGIVPRILLMVGNDQSGDGNSYVGPVSIDKLSRLDGSKKKKRMVGFHVSAGTSTVWDAHPVIIEFEHQNHCNFFFSLVNDVLLRKPSTISIQPKNEEEEEEIEGETETVTTSISEPESFFSSYKNDVELNKSQILSILLHGKPPKNHLEELTLKFLLCLRGEIGDSLNPHAESSKKNTMFQFFLNKKYSSEVIFDEKRKKVKWRMKQIDLVIDDEVFKKCLLDFNNSMFGRSMVDFTMEDLSPQIFLIKIQNEMRTKLKTESDTSTQEALENKIMNFQTLYSESNFEEFFHPKQNLKKKLYKFLRSEFSNHLSRTKRYAYSYLLSVHFVISVHKSSRTLHYHIILQKRVVIHFDSEKKIETFESFLLTQNETSILLALECLCPVFIRSENSFFSRLHNISVLLLKKRSKLKRQDVQTFVFQILKVLGCCEFDQNVIKFLSRLKNIKKGALSCINDLRYLNLSKRFWNRIGKYLKLSKSKSLIEESKKQGSVWRFRSHRELDQFLSDCNDICYGFSASFPGEWRLLKGFDLAFWWENEKSGINNNENGIDEELYCPGDHCHFKEQHQQSKPLENE